MHNLRSDAAAPCFSVTGLTFAYPNLPPALNDVSFTIPCGQFVLLCGTSGSGKSTLLRLLKPSMAPCGTQHGDIRFFGVPLSDGSLMDTAARIAFVGQSPDTGIITDRVWHELAFGAESLGWDRDTIRTRVAETASFFGLSDLFHRECATLSGGQKQLVCLASAMVLRPDVLLLDEPTAQLDPIAAEQFLGVLRRINTELGTTVILSEHRLEQVFPLCDRVLVLENGVLTADDLPGRMPGQLAAAGSPMRYAMPCASRVFRSVTAAYPTLAADISPITVREGCDFLRRAVENTGICPDVPGEAGDLPPAEAIALSAQELFYRYPDTTEDVLRGCSLAVPRSACYAILGANGAGKSTALSILAGVRRPDSGTVQHDGRVRLLPQNPALLLTEPTVRASLARVHAMHHPGAVKTDSHFSGNETAVLSLCGLLPLLDRHPRDLSGGELQRAALAAVLLSLPGWNEGDRCTDILLLDEPTKGTDAAFRRQLGALLSHLRARGMTVVIISHDLEFCAENATVCAMFFDGAVTASAPPRRFFAQNRFYTTAAHRMSAAVFPDCVTPDDMIRACGISPEPPPAPVLPTASPDAAASTEALRSPAEEAARIRKNAPGSRLRRTVSGILFALALVLFFCISRFTDLHTLTAFSAGSAVLPSVRDLLMYGAFTASLLAAVFLLPGRAAPPHEGAVIGAILPPEESTPKKPLRLWLSCAFLWLCIPATLALGIIHLGVRGYMTTSLLVLLEGMLPFFLLFEGRRPGARRVALIACLCALGVAGRAAFFMLPQFKPVLALVILAGAALGAQTGFLCGALTMLLSNMLFGQGPWTPWQMFAMGMSGFLAGLLFCRKSARPPRRLPLCIFGGICAVLFYGPLMNFASALIYGQSLTLAAVLPFFVTGFPLDCIHAAATVLFLYVLGRPVTEQLIRIRTKYRF